MRKHSGPQTAKPSDSNLTAVRMAEDTGGL